MKTKKRQKLETMKLGYALMRKVKPLSSKIEREEEGVKKRLKADQKAVGMYGPSGWVKEYRADVKHAQESLARLQSGGEYPEASRDRFFTSVTLTAGRLTLSGHVHRRLHVHLIYTTQGLLFTLKSPEDAARFLHWCKGEAHLEHQIGEPDTRNYRLLQHDNTTKGRGIAITNGSGLCCLISPKEAEELIIYITAWACAWDMVEKVL